MGVNLLPMTTGARVVPNQTVLISDGRIAAVGPTAEVQVPSGSQPFDGAGQYLVAGLADMHVHLEHFQLPDILKLFLVDGVTTVRNMDGRPYILEWREAVTEGELPGPTIYSAGPILDGDPPVRDDNAMVQNAQVARKAVREQVEAGYDFIRVYTNLSLEAHRAVLKAAEEAGVPLAGHVPRRVSTEEALTRRQMPLTGQHSPHLAGTVEVDLPRGGITGDLCLSDLPARADTVRFVLHRGLNVKRIHDGGGAARPYVTEAEPHGIGLRYVVRTAASDTLPSRAVGERGICVEYTGAFPIYDADAGDYAISDGSSVVAFNGRTLRARGETRWYPVPTDPQTDQAQESLTFHLRVRCPACKQLYLNGVPPQPGPEAIFVSETPREVVILAGDFPVQRVAGMLLLGENVAPDTARLFVQQVAAIQRFYEEFVGVPYGPNIDFVRIIPVRLDRPFQMWGFFADPMMGVTGVTVGDFVQILGVSDHPARSHLFEFLGHELAHRYFSGRLGGPYNQLFGEPFANYLGLKATRHFSGEDAYWEGLHALHRHVIEGPDLPPLDQADPRTLGSDPYRYRYAPLLLFALEGKIGEERMRRVLHALLTAPETEQAQADYAFFRRTALRAGVPKAAWQRWEEECVHPPVSQNRCLRVLLPSH